MEKDTEPSEEIGSLKRDAEALRQEVKKLRLGHGLKKQSTFYMYGFAILDGQLQKERILILELPLSSINSH